MQIEQKAYSIDGFCLSHAISRPQFYLLEKIGKAPKTYRFKRRRYISCEAAEAWRRRMEKESE